MSNWPGDENELTKWVQDDQNLELTKRNELTLEALCYSKSRLKSKSVGKWRGSVSFDQFILKIKMFVYADTGESFIIFACT